MASRQAIIQKFGRSPDIDGADTNEEVWDGTGAYTFPAAATAMTASSSSAADDGDPVGTGALTVTVIGLNSSWVEVSQTVTMNGQTAVSLPIPLIRVYRAFVASAGTGGVNAGDIWVGSGTVTAGVPANKHAGILAGFGQTLMAVYSVPATATQGALITEWYADIGGATATYATMALQVREFGGAWQSKRVNYVRDGQAIRQRLTWEDEEGNRVGGISVGAKSDIRLRCILNGANNSQLAGGFNVELYS